MRAIKNIGIPKPCEQSWREMTPNDKGRYCNVCAKTVTDFSAMTTNDVIAYLSLNQNACGRFGDGQIETINQRLDQPGPNVLNGWKKWGLAVGILTSLGYLKANAQAKPSVVQLSESVAKKAFLFDINRQASTDSTRVITGTVLDENNQALPGAKIEIEGTNIVATSSVMGKFTLAVPGNVSTFNVSYIGFETQKVLIDPTSNATFTVKLKDKGELLSVVVGGVYVERPSLFKRLKHLLTGRY